jgi:TolA-binding protein
MIQEDCRSELVLADRRGSLSPNEREALMEHLNVCEHCKLARLFGQAFDEPEDVRTNDAERLDAMLAAAERWRLQPRSLARPRDRKRTAKVVFLAAAITVTATAAAAAIAVRSLAFLTPPAAEITSTKTQRSSESSDTSLVQKSATSGVESSSQTVPAATIDDRPSDSEKDAIAPSVAIKSVKTSEVVARPEPTAEQLLQQANASRRAGNTTEASRLFRKLQRNYPSSREARLSEVVFGTLLLEQGQAAAALEQLNRYLSVGSTQNLAAEALYGKGRALAQLGRNSEEQDVWRALLERFPKSPYVSHARSRLGLPR